ncbi:hypothetical protein JOF29_003066 [Kribbella aluminosa]|uniref:HEAT repeat protein n=1 Tax=Kribbella aluminosa TaxID=416017 RepID=A0ABS4UK02_9ACTN|nr:hypothetical protein [Kribbella aluminosa]MBP2351983.1 hypothetical protein [Kribbella aluminosa]
MAVPAGACTDRPDAEPDLALRRALLLLHPGREPEVVEQLHLAIDNPSTRRPAKTAIALGRMSAERNDTDTPPTARVQLGPRPVRFPRDSAYSSSTSATKTAPASC